MLDKLLTEKQIGNMEGTAEHSIYVLSDDEGNPQKIGRFASDAIMIRIENRHQGRAIQSHFAKPTAKLTSLPRHRVAKARIFIAPRSCPKKYSRR